MQFRCCAAVLYLLSVFAMGQNPASGLPSAQNPIHGIKILASSFDSTTSPQRVQLKFINDSPANITAWGYCIKAEKANNSDPYQGFCTHVDPTSVVIDREIQERITLRTQMGSCSDCYFIHPGEPKILSANFSLPVVSASIQINFIAYSDGRVETAGQQGTSSLEAVANQRRGLLRLSRELADMGKEILAVQTDPHPAMSMINRLQNRVQEEPILEGSLRILKKPEWRHGNEREFIPVDERGYLNSFVQEEEMKMSELSKYQIQRAGQ